MDVPLSPFCVRTNVWKYKHVSLLPATEKRWSDKKDNSKPYAPCAPCILLCQYLLMAYVTSTLDEKLHAVSMKCISVYAARLMALSIP